MLRASRDVRGAGGLVRPAATVDPAPASTAIPEQHEASALPDVSRIPDAGAPDLAAIGSGSSTVGTKESAESAVRPEVSVYGQLVTVAQGIIDAAKESRSPAEAEIIRALRDVRRLLAQDDRLLTETVRQRHGDGTWARRGANTAVLAVRLGMEIDYDERRCLAVGLCGLMHDLGMLRVPDEVLESPHLTPAQLELLRQHPLESQKIVAGFGPSFAWIGKIVVQVHERFDGSGYPCGLQGQDIHEMARILGLVDTYEAMAHPRADRGARVTYHALKEIIDLRNTLFERRLIKALIQIVSIFPLGSLVKLNSGDLGRVIGTSRTHPTRPVVEVVMDSRGRRLEPPRELNLEQEPMLYIVDPAIEEQTLGASGGQRAE